MNTPAPTGLTEQIETIETAIEMQGLTAHERDCLRATHILLQQLQHATPSIYRVRNGRTECLFESKSE